MKYILAHDLGTSGNKATLFSEEGILVGNCTASYATHYESGGKAEQDPYDWWRAFCDSTAQLLEHIDVSDIAVISFSGQMMGCLCVDSKGEPLQNSIIYSDQRSVEQVDRLAAQMDAREFYETTGTRLNPSYSLEKLMWVADHEPEVFANCHKVLQAKEFLVHRITGRMVTDYNDASGTSAFDIRKKTWSDRVLDIAGVGREKFPEAVPCATVIGETNGRFLQEASLPAGIPVVIGSGDGGAATIGAGSVSPGRAYNYMGSSSWISLTTEMPFYDDRMSIFNWVHPVPGYYQPCGSMQTAGSSFEWAKNLLSCDCEGKGESIYKNIDEEVMTVPPMANGTLFLPYLMAERTPWWDPDVKGAFLGLGLKTTKKELFRAVIEGICFNLNMIKDIYREAYPLEQMRVFGGLAKSDVILQILADVTGLELHIPNYLEEATSMGAAVIGGVGVGLFDDFSVIDQFIRITKVVRPEAQGHAVYAKYTHLLERGYHALEGLNRELHAIG